MIDILVYWRDGRHPYNGHITLQVIENKICLHYTLIYQQVFLSLMKWLSWHSWYSVAVLHKIWFTKPGSNWPVVICAGHYALCVSVCICLCLCVYVPNCMVLAELELLGCTGPYMHTSCNKYKTRSKQSCYHPSAMQYKIGITQSKTFKDCLPAHICFLWCHVWEVTSLAIGGQHVLQRGCLLFDHHPLCG